MACITLTGVDFVLYKLINGQAQAWDGYEDVMTFVSDAAPYVFLALLAGLFLARGKWVSQNARHGVLAAGLAALVALEAAHLISAVVDRARPYVAHPADAHLFVAPSHDPSFPSDHATAAFAIAVSILLRNRRAGWIAMVMAALVSFSRVVLGTHYPGDVLAGAVIGTLAALLLWVPPVRRPLHALADWCGALYETVLSRTLAGLRHLSRGRTPRRAGAGPAAN